MNIKPLEELNREFMAEKNFPAPAKEKKKPGVLAVTACVLFYSAVAAALILASANAKSKTPKMFMGYAFFSVLSSSMQDEIPQGSLILVNRTDPDKLKVGDNITYIRGWGPSVTHKIEEIFENYQNSGSPGFKTKGVNNADPDRETVREGDIIGKVIFVLPAAGEALSYLVKNIHIIYIIFGLAVVFYLVTHSARIRKRKRDEGL